MWNYTGAVHECEKAILFQQAGKTCIKLENVEYKMTVKNCIADILVFHRLCVFIDLNFPRKRKYL